VKREIFTPSAGFQKAVPAFHWLFIKKSAGTGIAMVNPLTRLVIERFE
jgi:hypothetical protein